MVAVRFGAKTENVGVFQTSSVKVDQDSKRQRRENPEEKEGNKKGLRRES